MNEKGVLTAYIVEDEDLGFTGWIVEIRGVVAQGKTLDEVKRELIKMLKIKFLINHEEATEDFNKFESENVHKEELNFSFA